MLFDQAIDMPASLSSGDVTVTLMGERIRYNLRIKPGDVAAVKKASGLKLASKIGASSVTKKVTSMKVGPNEWIIIADTDQRLKLDAVLAKISNQFICSVTDISHRNIAFEITGKDATKLINVGCPMDLSLDVFPVGKAARTVFESAQIMILRTDESHFHLECWRSFAPYMRDFFVRVMTTR